MNIIIDLINLSKDEKWKFFNLKNFYNNFQKFQKIDFWKIENVS